MFNDYLFFRRAEVIIGQRVKGNNGPVEPTDGLSFGTDEDGNQFRIRFKVEKNDLGKPNKSTIEIYNLNEDSLSFLEGENLVIFLRVGYGDNPLSTLFFGDIVRFNEKRDGAEIITVIECGDAELVLRTSNIQIGRGPGVTNREIFTEAANKLLVSTSFLDELPEKKFLNGFTYAGSVAKLLDTLTSQVNYKWSIQDGELLLLGPKKTDQTEAVFFDDESGLIGYPTKTKDGVEFNALLHPDVRPGKPVVIQSARFMKGQGETVRVNKTVHEGDTHGDKWEVHAEGTIV